jgi:hypothetical protein
MRHIDMIRLTCGLTTMVFLFEVLVNGGNPDICMPAALIASIPLVIAEAKHLHNRLKRRG